MQVVSASKLRRVKEQAEDLNVYSAVLIEIMRNISLKGNVGELSAGDRKFFSKNLYDLPNLLVIMTSERGLCGGFNSSILKTVKADLANLDAEGKDYKILVVGKKGYDVLKSKYADKIEKLYHIGRDNSECIAKQVKDKIISMVEDGEVGPCNFYYSKFKNAMTQIVTNKQVLPAEKLAADEGGSTISNYDYEGECLVHEVIGQYINGLVNYGLLQSRASEEGARMTAMDSATRNANELIDKLTLKLNRSRQSIITTELIEIIAGAEAI
jgi:F-type H+-transporting ATPase subunit gamma